jgi:hypothetical protein
MILSVSLPEPRVHCILSSSSLSLSFTQRFLLLSHD